MKKIPYLRDVKFQQELDYPTVPVEIDREQRRPERRDRPAGGQRRGGDSSSSRYVARNFWVDPKNGISYQVQVEVPTPQMNSPAQLETVPLAQVNPDLNLMIRDVARVGQGTMPGEIDRTGSAALREHHGQRRGRRPRPRRPAGRAGHRRRGRAPARRPRPDARPGGAHERDVHLAGGRPGPRGGGDPGAA